jgi:hypothetical protein
LLVFTNYYEVYVDSQHKYLTYLFLFLDFMSFLLLLKVVKAYWGTLTFLARQISEIDRAKSVRVSQPVPALMD